MAGQRNDYGKRLHAQPENIGNEESKRRNPTEEKESNAIGPEDTVYRYLCPLRRIGSIIGVGGDIAKQLRAETHAKIRISETIPGCEERVVTIYSSNEETNSFGDDDDLISPAQDALFRVHDRIVAEESQIDDGSEEPQQVTVRLLVPSDQIGCVIGKGGQVVQSIRSETGAQVRILSSEHLPPCALTSDELIQISGEAHAVRKALYRVSSRIHDNPSRSQHLLLSSASIYRSGGAYVNMNAGAPLLSSLPGPYRSYRNAGGDWAASMKEFSLRLVCPAENVGAVIGKGGVIIKQIRQESGASIKIDTSAAEGEECIISVSAKETFEETSPTIDAAMRLQPRCSEKNENESDDPIITTRLLVPSSKIGCLIGKGGAVISEMRSATRATIRIFSDENIPKVASADDEMVQISGDMGVASAALLQVLMRLRANLFEMEGLAAVPSGVPLVPVPFDAADGSRHISRDSRMRGHGYSTYSGGQDSKYFVQSNGYGGPQVSGRGGYGGYGIYPSGRSGSSGLSGQNPVMHRKSYGY
ncbi:hypothetical protein M9H77_09952 [Catharanthus roseus]|uniref:Uncharacterized protein n=1 Tax=Catharanthus roseus TaxID=4058 RepID=A0ACC0C2E4_CATRO|nr:hypothetical protein M9H77_09952 [Catharanthus roseus]